MLAAAFAPAPLAPVHLVAYTLLLACQWLPVALADADAGRAASSLACRHSGELDRWPAALCLSLLLWCR